MPWLCYYEDYDMHQKYPPFTTSRILFYILAFLTPLLVTPINYELFEFNKMLLVYILTTLISIGIAIDFVRYKKVLVPATPLDIPIFLFLLSQLISTFLSIDPHISLFGYYGRFNGGLLSTLCYIILYYSAIIAFHESIPDLAKNVVLEIKNLVKMFGFSKTAEDALPLPITVSFNEKALTYLIYATFTSALLVTLYAVAQKFGIDAHLWVQDVQNRVFSTLGQPNWLAAYLVTIIFIATGLILIDTNINKFVAKIISSVGVGIITTIILNAVMSTSLSLNTFISVSFALSIITYGIFITTKKFQDSSLFFVIFPVLFYSGLLFTKSRSGFLAFWICNIIFLVIILIKKNIISRAKWLMVLPFYSKSERTSQLNKIVVLNILFVLFTLLLNSPISIPWINRNSATIEQPTGGTALEDVSFNTRVTDSGDIRKIVWNGAWQAAVARPYFGWGVETFSWAYYRFKPVEHNLTSEWDFLYNKAHNEYLNYAATTGFVGLGTYLLFILIYLGWWFKNVVKRKLSSESIMIIATGVGWISLLITNFFGFSVVVTSLLFWLLPAVSFLIGKSASISTFMLKLTPLKAKIMIMAIALFGLYLTFSIACYWLADYYYAKGIAAAEQDKYDHSYEMLSTAIALRPEEPAYLNEMSETLSVLAYAYDEQNDATMSGQLTEQAILATNKALSISPLNVSFWKGRTRIFYNLSQINSIYLDQAITSIETAQALAPTDPKVAYNRAILLNNAGKKEAATIALEQAIKMKPNYRDAAWALAIYYEEDKNIGKRDEWLNYILERINPEDSEVKQKLAGK